MHLSIDDSSQSEAARSALDASGIIYQLIYEPGFVFGCPRVSAMVDGEALEFEGYDAITDEFVPNVAEENSDVEIAS